MSVPEPCSRPTAGPRALSRPVAPCRGFFPGADGSCSLVESAPHAYSKGTPAERTSCIRRQVFADGYSDAGASLDSPRLVSQGLPYGSQDFLGVRVVVDGAGKDERSDEGTDGHDRLASCVVASTEHARDDANVSIDQSVVAVTDVIVASVHVAYQRGHRAAGSRFVAVFWRDVPIDPGAERIPFVVHVPVHGSVRVRKGVVRGFADQVVSRLEVLVEAAVGEAGRPHDLGNTGSLEALFTDPG